MLIDVCIQTHNFNKRLCWMLSSIAQQEGDTMGICVRPSFVGGHGAEAVVRAFPSLSFRTTTYPCIEAMMKRGEVRNRDLRDFFGLKNTNADFILWADSDMIYPPNFFSELKKVCESNVDTPELMYSQRFSTTLEETEALINKYEYPCEIPNAWEKCKDLKGELKANIGAGYFHLCSVKMLFEKHGGYYVEKTKDYDWFEKFPKCKSDQQFRRRVGKKRVELPIQIHLQHTRASEDKKCLGDER